MTGPLPHNPKVHSLGHLIESSDATIFFGNRASSNETLAVAFPDFEFTLLNQTHSDVVVIADSEGGVLDGDAHITSTRKLGLCIRTADCLPVMIHDPDTQMVAAIHAGWRGLQNEIIRKTCRRLNELGATLARAKAWIGPHIGPQSFEVRGAVADQLAHSFEAVRGFADVSSALSSHPDPEKSFVDLLAIARAQLVSSNIGRERTTTLNIDTFLSSDHSSFRRDASSAGRQISFIAIK